VLPFALAGLPYRTRCWADDYGLFTGEDDELHLTEVGREVAAAAAERELEPYADVSVEALSEQTRQTIGELRRSYPEAPWRHHTASRSNSPRIWSPACARPDASSSAVATPSTPAADREPGRTGPNVLAIGRVVPEARCLTDAVALRRMFRWLVGRRR
jgi:hypothetical protein